MAHISTSQSGLNHAQFTSKKDLQNIAHKFGIAKQEILHQNDVDSVRSMGREDKAGFGNSNFSSAR